jgi:hypothetical protein
MSVRQTAIGVLAAVALTLAAAPIASADVVVPPAAKTVEPILTLEGQSTTCTPGTGLNVGLKPIVTSPPPAWNVPAVPASWVQAWTVSPAGGPYTGYDQCTISTDSAANRLYAKLVAFKAQLIAAGGTVGKIDVASVSYGTTVSRYCIKLVAGCAALIDDWVGIVPPSHGSTSFSSIDCNYVPYKPACQAAKVNGSIVTAMNAGDETPNGENDPGGWIEYTTIRATNDGVIYPAGSEKLSGAANWRIKAPSADTTHSNWGGPLPECEGSTTYSGRGAAEAIAAELLDYTNRSTYLPTPTSAFDVDFACGTNLTLLP